MVGGRAASIALILLDGIAAWHVTGTLGLHLPFAFAFVFGALPSPTDPMAVLSILRRTRAPADLEPLVTGESLSTDGVGVVLFGITPGLAVGTSELSAAPVALLFVEEAVGRRGLRRGPRVRGLPAAAPRR